MDKLWTQKSLNQAAVDDVDNFSEKKCYEKIFLREKESEILSTSPQSHTAPTPPLLPGKGNSSEEYFRSPLLGLLWHNRNHLSRVRRHRSGGFALD